MLFYPQLTTGAVSQYPITRHSLRRTIVNTMDDGSSIRMADVGAAATRWDLTHTMLNLDEVNSLERLFASTFGRWGSFTFLDPTDSLVSWSEDLTQSCWSVDPLLGQQPGLPDALGGTAATRLTNGAQIDQSLSQRLAAPASYEYCFSLYAKSEQATSLTLFASDGAPSESLTSCRIGNNWSRLSYSISLATSSAQVEVGLRLAAGASAWVFGIQLEPQLSAGGYKKTRDRAGVYPNTRFDMDSIQVTATAPNQFSCQVRLCSNVAG